MHDSDVSKRASERKRERKTTLGATKLTKELAARKLEKRTCHRREEQMLNLRCAACSAPDGFSLS